MAVCEDSDVNYPNVVAITPYEESGVHANFLSDPFFSGEEATSDDEETTETDAEGEAAEEPAAEEEAAAEPEVAADADSEESTDEETEENVYVFCPGVTKQDLAKSN
jgi:hypothetical protein